MRGLSEETVIVRPIHFQLEVDPEPSVVVDAAIDEWGTTVRILPADTVLEHYSDGAPCTEISDVIHFRQRR